MVKDFKDEGKEVSLASLVWFLKRESKKANDPIQGRSAIAGTSEGKKAPEKQLIQSKNSSFATRISQSKMLVHKNDLKVQLPHHATIVTTTMS